MNDFHKQYGDIISLNATDSVGVTLKNGAKQAFGAPNNLRKVGKKVTLDMGVSLDDVALVMYNTLDIATIPEEYKPVSRAITSAISRANGYYYIQVDSNGNISVQPFSTKASSLNTIAFHLSWLTN